MARSLKSIDPLLKEYLDHKAEQYEQIGFIKDDPLSIPHSFRIKEDIEISAFLASTIAWGKRVSIINNAKRILDIMDNAPHDFILNHGQSDLKRCDEFVHRTFNAFDLKFFFQRLQKLYKDEGGLENAFKTYNTYETAIDFLPRFHAIFFKGYETIRSKKHLGNPLKGSAAKRLNMFLRWMVRDNKQGVDFGIWNSISPSQLSIPLDVHTGNVGRKLGLLSRNQNDWKSVSELDTALRTMDKKDPTKYDFALFGIGVNKELE